MSSAVTISVTCPLCHAPHDLSDLDPSLDVQQDVCPECSANLVLVGETLPTPSSPATKNEARSGRVAGKRKEAPLIVVIGLAALSLFHYALLGAAVFGAYQSVKGSEAYKMSEAFIRSSEQVKQTVGEDMRFGTLPAWHVRSNRQRTMAKLRLDVMGSLGATVVDLDLERRGRQWRIVEARYRDATGTFQPLPTEETTPAAATVTPLPTSTPHVEPEGQSSAPGLTENRITAVLEKLDRAANERDVEGILMHIAPDAVLHVSVEGPQQTPQRLVLTRDQYGAILQQGFDVADDYGFLRRTNRIQVAPDGQRAEVESRTLENTTTGGRTTQAESVETTTIELRDGRPMITKLNAVVGLTVF